MATAFPQSRPIRAGNTLYRQGEPGTHLFRIAKGFIKLNRLQPNGKEAIVGLRTAGWVLGVSTALLDEPHVATAIAATDCTVAQLEVRTFRRLLKCDHGLSDAVHRMQSREIHDQLVELGELSCCSASDRLVMLLTRLGDELGATTGHQRRYPLRQWELAQLVGVAPQYLSQLLARMRCGQLTKNDKRAASATTGLS